MRNLKSVVLMFALFLGLSAFAGNEKATIKTSTQCEMCQETLEASIGKMAGVNKVMVTIESKELTVKFDNSIVTLEEIKTEVTNTGYWADEMMPNKDAYAALPSCCKPKKACCAAGTSKSSCSKDASKKEACGADCTKPCCSKDGAKVEGTTAPVKKQCTGHTH
jgi:copper chaperone CopZ